MVVVSPIAGSLSVGSSPLSSLPSTPSTDKKFSILKSNSSYENLNLLATISIDIQELLGLHLVESDLLLEETDESDQFRGNEGVLDFQDSIEGDDMFN